MRTTIDELMAMLQIAKHNQGGNCEVVLNVRMNSSDDYSVEKRLEIVEHGSYDRIVIKDLLS